MAILGDARSIITGVDLLKARAKGMSAGLEPELSVVIDVFYPIDAVTQVAKEFRQKYPGVGLRIYVEALGGAIKPVLDGRCSIGVIGSLPVIPDTLTYERLPGIAFLMVAAREHALTSYRGKIPKEVLAKHTQIVLTDRSELSLGREFGVMSTATWRLADLFAKHHSLLKGLGWGGMPLHAVRKDLEEGRLSSLPIEDVPPDGLMLPMSAVWQTKSPPGPAGRWFVDRLKQIPVETGKAPTVGHPGRSRDGLREFSRGRCPIARSDRYGRAFSTKRDSRLIEAWSRSRAMVCKSSRRVWVISLKHHEDQ